MELRARRPGERHRSAIDRPSLAEIEMKRGRTRLGSQLFLQHRPQGTGVVQPEITAKGQRENLVRALCPFHLEGLGRERRRCMSASDHTMG